MDKPKIEPFNERRISVLKDLQERGLAIILLENRLRESLGQYPLLRFPKLPAAQQERMLATQSALKERLQNEVEYLLSILLDIRCREYTSWEETALLRIVLRHMDRVAGVFASYEETARRSGIPRRALSDAELGACREELHEKQREVEARLMGGELPV